jgi:PAS domain S-box-containing protein
LKASADRDSVSGLVTVKSVILIGPDAVLGCAFLPETNRGLPGVWRYIVKWTLKRSLKITGIYLVFGLLWITVSDQLLVMMVQDSAEISLISMYKGWFFIFITALLFFILSKHSLEKQAVLMEEAVLSEKRLMAVIETTNTGYIVLNEHGRVLYANQIYAGLAGYSTYYDLMGRSVVEWTAPYDQQRNEAEVAKCISEGRICNLCVDYLHSDGKIVPVEINAVTIETRGGLIIVALCRDITDRRVFEQERSETIEFLRLVNESRGTEELIRTAATFFKRQSGCEALGIRLKEGEDYPYFETRGFSHEFLLTENSLCARDCDGRLLRDDSGNAIMECMCGGIILGGDDRLKSFCTEHGSFWTNSTSEFQAEVAIESLKIHVRNKCNEYGYESVAMLPLVSGNERLGLLQLNDRRKGIFSPGLIAHWERLAGHLAVALAKSRTEEALRKAEERYFSLYQSMRDGFCLTGMDGQVIEHNEAFMEMLGYNSEELRKINLNDIIPEKWRGMEKKIIETQLIPRGYTEVYVQEYQRKEGAVMPAEVRAFLVTDEHGSHTGMWKIVRDLTESMRAQEAMLESEKRYHLLFQNLLEGFAYCKMIYDNDGRPADFIYIDVNDAFERLTGLKDVISKRVTEVIPGIGESNPELFEIYGRVAETGRPERFEIYLQPLLAWLSVSVYSTECGYFSAVFDNITPRKTSEEERLILEAQLLQSQKMEAIGKLAGGVAHDFNNVINAIMGFCTLIQMKLKPDDPATNYLREILSASERAANLTNSLLAFSRKQIISVKPVNLNESIRSVAKLCKNFLGEDLKLVLDLEEKDVVVVADSGQLDQILMNLATNARDAMPEGGTLTIGVRLVEIDRDFIRKHGFGAEGKYAVIFVDDTGCGIREDIRNQIFEPFFTTKEVGKGTGLGLSIVYGIVKQHNGFIDVFSRPGEGSSFRIYLPAVNLKVEKADLLNYVPVNGGKELILLVEDEKVLRTVTRKILEEFGYRVIEAVDGIDAVEKFRESQDEISLTLMDIVMPGKNGRDAYQAIRGIREDARVIFLSGYTSDHISGKIRDEGHELMFKPFSPRELLNKIRSVLDKR